MRAIRAELWQADELLHGLERKQLLQRVRRSSIQGETEFQFGHAMTKDVAYSQIRRADRAQKHEAAAAWIEKLAGERDDKAELLADHYSQALTLREALGEDTTPIAAKARAALTEAARQAAATYAHTAAARHFEAALKLTPLDDDPSRAALLLGQATALVDADIAVEQLLTEARDAQVRVEAWDAAAQVERMLGRWYGHEGQAEEAEAHLASAAVFASRVPPGETMCMIAYDQAYRLVISGQPAQALALVDGMIPLAEEAGLEVGRALLLTWRGWARIDCGDADGMADMRKLRSPSQRMRTRGRPRRTATWRTRCAPWETWPARTRSTPRPRSGRAGLPFRTTRLGGRGAGVPGVPRGPLGSAERLLAQMATPAGFLEHQVGICDGHIKLARGEANEALLLAVAAIGYAGTSDNDEFLYFGASLEARCHQALNKTHPRSGRATVSWHAGMSPGGSPAGRSNCARPPPSSPSPVITPRSATLPCCSRGLPLARGPPAGGGQAVRRGGHDVREHRQPSARCRYASAGSPRGGGGRSGS